MIYIRCSSLSDFMTKPKSADFINVLSEGALTACYDLAKQFVYSYRPEVSSRAIEKGLEVEDKSISMFGRVNFLSVTKNTTRFKKGFITGEPDFFDPYLVDIKSSWSFDSFPATKAIAEKSGKKAGYDWQLRGYMYLCDLPHGTLAYCLTDTPDRLIGYESEALHKFGHIDEALRVTQVRFERDKELEEWMLNRVQLAQTEIQKQIDLIGTDHE